MFFLTLHLPTIICKPLSQQLLLTFLAISTTPTLVRLFSSHPQTLCWGFKVQGPARKDIIPSVRGPRLPLAPATPSLLGRSGRMRQALRRPRQPRSPRPSRALGHRQSRTRPPPERGVTRRTPKPSPTPQSGQVPGLLTDTHRAAAAPSPPQPQPPPLSHSRRLFPRGVRAGAASPPDPPLGCAPRGARIRWEPPPPPPFLPPPSVRPSHRGPPRISGIRSQQELGVRTSGFGSPIGRRRSPGTKMASSETAEGDLASLRHSHGRAGPRERWSVKSSLSGLLSEPSP